MGNARKTKTSFQNPISDYTEMTAMANIEIVIPISEIIIENFLQESEEIHKNIS